MSTNRSSDTDIRSYFTSPVTYDKFKPKFTSTPINASNRRPKPIKPDNDNKQMVLDFGQASIGMKYCDSCGMMYSADVQTDVKFHDQYHNRFTEPKSFKVETRSATAWKSKNYNEVIAGKICGTLFMVENKARSAIKTRFETIIKEFVDPQLAICADVPVFDKERKQRGFLFVVDATLTTPSYIGAVVLAEKVPAGKLMPAGKVYNEECGFVAIERLWVHPLLRKNKIATKMLDVARRLFSTQKALGKARVAFCEPNSACIEFAKHYLDEKKSQRYIVYDHDEMSKIINPSIASKKNDEDIKVKKVLVKKVDEKGVATKAVKKEGDPKPEVSRKRPKVEENKENVRVTRKRTKVIARSESSSDDRGSERKMRVIGSDEAIIKLNEVQELVPTLVIEDEDTPGELDLSLELF